MPTFKVTAPDGTVMNVAGPEGATQEEAVKKAQAHYNKQVFPVDPSLPPFSPVNTTEVERVSKHLLNTFKSPSTAAALLGNISVETGGSFDHLQKQGGGGKGRGLFQFDFMRKSYATYLGGKPDTPEAQIDFVHNAIYGKKSVLGDKRAKELRQILDSETLSAGAKALAFSNLFEQPNPAKAHNAKRSTRAEGFYKRFKAQENTV